MKKLTVEINVDMFDEHEVQQLISELAAQCEETKAYFSEVEIWEHGDQKPEDRPGGHPEARVLSTTVHTEWSQ